ncbi:hypothetical protein TELCIR_08301 [Teladorsagia circumcincta]|uniref:Uncharacterized protein n=1 Tax=Teladorsagia circumcincta TaxID=45464 RepID=A0A2G9UHZ8_TELCI|nr:hypothetical protein TELCIR_08301 [Teladorsagia circumcincta]
MNTCFGEGFFQREYSTIIHIVVVVLANSFAFAVNAVHYKLNKRYYWEAKSGLDGIRKYSLGARYQIAENIRICHTSDLRSQYEADIHAGVKRANGI